MAVRSILSQEGADLELVLIDDGSTSTDALRELDHWAEADRRVRLYRHGHVGLTRSLNAGLTLCRGHYVCRHDADDWSEPNRLSSQVEFLRNNAGIAVVGSSVRLCQENGRKLWDVAFPERPIDVMAAFPQANPFCHGAVCFRRDAALAIGGYSEEFEYSQDYDFLWRLCEYGGGANLPEVLYHLRRTATAISAVSSQAQHRYHLLAKQRARERSGLRTPDRGRGAERLPEPSARLADQLLLAGHYWRAFTEYARILRERPASLRAYLKLSRWVAFVFCPPMRRLLFDRRI